MRILIDNSGYEMKNLGDIAMLQVAISRIRELFPAAELYVFTNQPERLVRYCPTVIPVTNDGRSLWCQTWNILGGLHGLVPKKFHFYLRLLEQIFRNKYPHLARVWITRRFRKRNVNVEKFDSFFSLLESVEIVIATGGGYITDTFEQHANAVLSVFAIAQARNISTYMFGQGIGPLQSVWLLRICRQILPQLKYLALREGRASRPLLTSLGLRASNVSITGDDAIELAYRNKPEKLGNALGINIRVASYSEVNERLLKHVQKVLQRSQNKYHTMLVPIPISMHDEDSDIFTIAKLTDDLDKWELNALNTPNKVIENAGKCRVIITGSYHAGVFGLSQGVTVIGLAKSQYYRDKFNGLAAQFKIGCFVVDMGHDDFPRVLENCIDEAWDSAPQNRTSLLEQAICQIEKSKQGYKTLQNWDN